MATIGSAKATLVNKIDSLTSTATAKDTIFLAKALKENSSLNNFVWQGNWAATTEYSIDDVVASGGNPYMGKAAHTSGLSFALGSDWDMMVGAGTNGTNGTNGTDGASGFPAGGTVGQVVTNTGSGAGGWADAAGGGKVLQVVQVTSNSELTLTTSAQTFLSKTITPIGIGSSFLVTHCINGVANQGSGVPQIVAFHKRTGGSGGTNSVMLFGYLGYFTGLSFDGNQTSNVLDTPTYTAGGSLTYYNTGYVVGSNTGIHFNQWGVFRSSLTIMEIGA